VDEKNHLLGTVTDGDIRRGILRGVPFDDPVSTIMNQRPVVAGLNEGREEMLARMKLKDLRNIPLVDDQGCVVGVESLSELILPGEKANWVVLMAGGKGSRLRPFNEDCPKPLLRWEASRYWKRLSRISSSMASAVSSFQSTTKPK